MTNGVRILCFVSFTALGGCATTVANEAPAPKSPAVIGGQARVSDQSA